MNVERVLAQIDSAKRRLEDQERLLEESEEALSTALAQGLSALAADAKPRVKRQKAAVASTRSVIQELTKLLPPAPKELNLKSPK